MKKIKDIKEILLSKRDNDDSNLELKAYEDGIIDCFNLINKPVETTNEQPQKDLEILYEDQKNIQYPIFYKREYGLEVQLTGISISLRNDGTFSINDTTGG